jgi:hypothetical protein
MSDSGLQSSVDPVAPVVDTPAQSGGVDQVTEVTETSWLGRVQQSIVGVLVGLILLVIAVVLLFWNESNELATMRALAYGSSIVVEATADRVDPALDGKLVHLSGNLAAPAPASDPVFGAVAEDAIRLQRHVEMYQWKETSTSSTQKNAGGSSTTQTTYTYSKVWSENPIESSRFHSTGGHGNPPMPMRSTITNAGNARLGPRLLMPGVLDVLSGFTPATPSPSAILPAGWQATADGRLYSGQNPAQPTIGDLRVSFEIIPSGVAGVIAGQQGDHLAPLTAPNGRPIAIAMLGVADAPAMFAAARSHARILAWIFRGVGFVFTLVGLMLLARPLAVLVSVLPFLEGVVDAAAFVVMFGFAVLVTLVTIAIAHVVLQPVLSVALLGVGLAIAYAATRLRGRRAPAAP